MSSRSDRSKLTPALAAEVVITSSNKNKVNLGRRFRELLFERAVKQASFSHHKGGEPAWIFDAPQDVRYARPPHAAFDKTLHIFTQEWVGIRAAAGALPGSKLAISKNLSWNEVERRRVLEVIDRAGIEVVIAQGACLPLLDFLEQLRNAMPKLTIVGVWHGSLANWAFEEEHALASRFLDLATKNVFDRVCLMRRGTSLLHVKAVPYLTPNMVPMLDNKRTVPALAREKLVCLFAGWNNQWKNMYSNLVAAAASPRVEKVLSYSNATLPIALSAKLEMLNYSTREQHFLTMGDADLVLNVTVVDCHPMIEMEALAVGTPLLRGQLDLDFGQDHPFERLLTVDRVHDPIAIKDKLESVAGVPPSEMAEIIADYRRLVIETSLARYGEFLRGTR